MTGLVKMPKAKTAQGSNLSAIQDIAAANKNLMSMNKIKADVKFIAHLRAYFIFLTLSICRKGVLLPVMYWVIRVK